MDLPDDEALRWIVKTFAHLRAAHGEAIGEPVLVQPTGEFFPDEFRPDVPSVALLLRRMLDYAPVSSELRVGLGISFPEEDPTGGCGSSACAPSGSAPRPLGIDELDDGYRVTVSAADVAQPDVLTTSLARATGALVLHEAGEPVTPAASEVAAVACGLGVLLANGAAVWAKSCGGLRVARATAMPIHEIAVALALFAAVGGHKASQVRRHLGATQREAFEAAWDWVESNGPIVEALRANPARLESGSIELEPVRGVIGQWLHRRSLEKVMRAPVKPAPSSMTDERRRRLEEVSALLDLADP